MKGGDWGGAEVSVPVRLGRSRCFGAGDDARGQGASCRSPCRARLNWRAGAGELGSDGLHVRWVVPARIRGWEELYLLPGAAPGPRVLRGQGAGKRPLRHGEGHVALSLSLSQPGCAPAGCWGSVSASLCFFSSDPGKGKWSWVQFSPNLLHQAPALLTAPFQLRFMN